MELSHVFQELKKIMQPYAVELDCTSDDPGNFSLDTKQIMKNKKPLFFGAVQTKKNYVSYHLMPVYVNPSLLDNISHDLKKRMQGKSCFNFKATDDELFKELSALTQAGYESYKQAGYV
ncbi:MAG TPA: hypothetical protein PKE64_19810 [Anaerolineae bacterium]|nr:hypothetical protein [Anaerolineae bacterium]HMR66264.1 hypothetical protein [Anaerolineae bacterium]